LHAAPEEEKALAGVKRLLDHLIPDRKNNRGIIHVVRAGVRDPGHAKGTERLKSRHGTQPGRFGHEKMRITGKTIWALRGGYSMG
jgi:hypothetical protein